jgi:hypothetical protein
MKRFGNVLVLLVLTTKAFGGDRAANHNISGTQNSTGIVATQLPADAMADSLVNKLAETALKAFPLMASERRSAQAYQPPKRVSEIMEPSTNSEGRRRNMYRFPGSYGAAEQERMIEEKESATSSHRNMMQRRSSSRIARQESNSRKISQSKERLAARVSTPAPNQNRWIQVPAKVAVDVSRPAATEHEQWIKPAMIAALDGKAGSKAESKLKELDLRQDPSLWMLQSKRAQGHRPEPPPVKQWPPTRTSENIASQITDMMAHTMVTTQNQQQLWRQVPVVNRNQQHYLRQVHAPAL